MAIRLPLDAILNSGNYYNRFYISTDLPQGRVDGLARRFEFVRPVVNTGRSQAFEINNKIGFSPLSCLNIDGQVGESKAVPNPDVIRSNLQGLLGILADFGARKISIFTDYGAMKGIYYCSPSLL